MMESTRRGLGRLALGLGSAAIMLILLQGCGEAGKAGPIRIGVLLGVETFAKTVQGFKDEMKTLGYREGTEVVYDVRSAGGDKARMREIAETFVSDRVDYIFSITSGATQAAKNATETVPIPVFFAFVTAPVESGVVDDMVRPTGNITGIRNPMGEYVGKRLEFARRMLPNLRRIWIPLQRAYPTTKTILPSLRGAAAGLDMELQVTDVTAPADIVTYLEQVEPNSFDAILITPAAVTQHPAAITAIMEYSRKHRLPVIGNTPAQVRQGALLSYMVDGYDTGRQVARMVSRTIKRGNFVPDPVVGSDPKFVINTTTVEWLGLKMDDETRAFATDIYR